MFLLILKNEKVLRIVSNYLIPNNYLNWEYTKYLYKQIKL